MKPKRYSFLVDNNEHKKSKDANKNVVATIGHNEYKDALLKNSLRYLMNRIQDKDHIVENHEINKISFSCFDDKIHVQNNGYDRLALGYQS